MKIVMTSRRFFSYQCNQLSTVLMRIMAGVGVLFVPLQAEELVYPDDVFRPYYFVDVTKAPYSIDNTGKEDVTAKLKAAMVDLWHGGFPALRQKTLYFPNGTYRISDTLDTVGMDKAGKMVSIHRLMWIGQSRDKTIIKLDDNLTAFQDPTKWKPMIKTESIGVHGNDAYQNSIVNMTLDVGAGNPGASGIDYLASNNGEIHDVTIRAAEGSGYAGLIMPRAWPGPAFVKNLEVDGFQFGVFLTHMEYSLTFEHLILKNQREAGFENMDNGAFIRDLESTNTVPAIVNKTAGGLVVAVDSKFLGGDAKTPAVQNSGGLFLRNIEVQGYSNAVANTVKDGSPDAPGGNITEYTSHPVITNKGFPSSQKTSLGLEIRETPLFEDNDFSHWYSVGNKTKPDSGPADQADAIQAAIDEAATEGKTTFYFIPGQYMVGHTLNFHGSIRRVLGLGTVLRPMAGGAFDTPASEMPPPPPPKPTTPPPAPAPTVASTDAAAAGGPVAPVTPLPPQPPPPSPSSIKSDYGPPIFKVSDIVGDDIEFSCILTQPVAGAAGKITCFGFQQDTKKTLVLRDISSDICYHSTEGAGDLYVETGVGNGWFFDHPGQKIWARQLDPEGNASPKVLNVGSKLWILGFKTERPGIQIESDKGAETEVLGAILYPVRPPNDDPAFKVDNSRFSASYITIDNTMTPDFPRQLLEIRGTDEQVIHPEDTYARPCFGGARAALVPLIVAAPADSGTAPAK